MFPPPPPPTLSDLFSAFWPPLYELNTLAPPRGIYVMPWMMIMYIHYYVELALRFLEYSSPMLVELKRNIREFSIARADRHVTPSLHLCTCNVAGGQLHVHKWSDGVTCPSSRTIENSLLLGLWNMSVNIALLKSCALRSLFSQCP